MKTYTLSRRIRYFSAALVLAFGLAIAGCGGGTATVSGQVTFNGKKVPFGTVTIVSKKDTTQKGGAIKKGSYSVEGVPHGEATVTVNILPPAAGGSGPPTAKPKDQAGAKGPKEQLAKQEKEAEEQRKEFKETFPNGSVPAYNEKINVSGGSFNHDIKLK
jgi:hypothetical protein